MCGCRPTQPLGVGAGKRFPETRYPFLLVVRLSLPLPLPLPLLLPLLLPGSISSSHTVSMDTSPDSSSLEDFRKDLSDSCPISNWPSNALRHSFTSAHLAAFENSAETALQLGHQSAGIVFAHYRQLIRPRDAALYWEIACSTSTPRLGIGFSRPKDCN